MSDNQKQRDLNLPNTPIRPSPDVPDLKKEDSDPLKIFPQPNLDESSRNFLLKSDSKNGLKGVDTPSTNRMQFQSSLFNRGTPFSSAQKQSPFIHEHQLGFGDFGSAQKNLFAGNDFGSPSKPNFMFSSPNFKLTSNEFNKEMDRNITLSNVKPSNLNMQPFHIPTQNLSRMFEKKDADFGDSLNYREKDILDFLNNGNKKEFGPVTLNKSHDFPYKNLFCSKPVSNDNSRLSLGNIPNNLHNFNNVNNLIGEDNNSKYVCDMNQTISESAQGMTKIINVFNTDLYVIFDHNEREKIGFNSYLGTNLNNIPVLSGNANSPSVPKIKANFLKEQQEVIKNIIKIESQAEDRELPFYELSSRGKESQLSTIKCHCTKSKCLKLYCECFQMQEYCKNCACCNCYNSIMHDKEREKAIKEISRKNPTGFKSECVKKKPCNCTKSNCRKKYCECYQNGFSCTTKCKCKECKNRELNQTLKNYKNMKMVVTKEGGTPSMLGKKIRPKTAIKGDKNIVQLIKKNEKILDSANSKLGSIDSMFTPQRKNYRNVKEMKESLTSMTDPKLRTAQTNFETSETIPNEAKRTREKKFGEAIAKKLDLNGLDSTLFKQIKAQT